LIILVLIVFVCSIATQILIFGVVSENGDK